MAVLAVVVFILDRLSKHLIHPGDAFSLIPGIVGIRYAENTGMAFGFLSGRPWILGIVSLAIVCLGLFLLYRYRFSRLAEVGAMLMLGGAVGNMVDRFFTGYVVDMIELEFVHFAIFNIADSALTFGTCLVALALLTDEKAFVRKDGDGHG